MSAILLEARLCVVALTLTKVGKAGVKVGGNSSAWGGFFAVRTGPRQAVAHAGYMQN
jgi:hypothetical protein